MTDKIVGRLVGWIPKTGYFERKIVQKCPFLNVCKSLWLRHSGVRARAVLKRDLFSSILLAAARRFDGSAVNITSPQPLYTILCINGVKSCIFVYFWLPRSKSWGRLWGKLWGNCGVKSLHFSCVCEVNSVFFTRNIVDKKIRTNILVRAWVNWLNFIAYF